VKPLTVQIRLNRVIESRMDEHPLSLSPVDTAAALSADALRELQQRAQAVLAAGREHTARLEADITRQLDDITATLREQAGVEAHVAADAEQSQAELAQVRAEFTSARQSWQQERESLEIERETKRSGEASCTTSKLGFVNSAPLGMSSALNGRQLVPISSVNATKFSRSSSSHWPMCNGFANVSPNWSMTSRVAPSRGKLRLPSWSPCVPNAMRCRNAWKNSNSGPSCMRIPTPPSR
jgi:hypothetical protein